MAAPFLIIAAAAASAEQERNAPQTGQTDDGVNDPAEQCALTAKKPGNQIELENTYKTPVRASNDGQNQCQSIKHRFTSVLFWSSLDCPTDGYLYFDIDAKSVLSYNNPEWIIHRKDRLP